MPLFDTTGIKCDRWQMWYFYDGASKKPGTQWTSSDGKTPEDVEQDQRRAVESDHRYARFFNFDYPPKASHENFTGPICITSAAFSAKPKVLVFLNEIGDDADKAVDILKKVDQALDVLDAMGAVEKATIDIKPIEEYIENCKKVLEKIEKTRAIIMSNIDIPSVQIEADLTEIQQGLDNLKGSENILPQPVHRAKTPIFVKPSDCYFESQGSSQTNCDDSGCDTVTTNGACDDQGVMTYKTCTANHHTGQTVCTEDAGDAN